MAGTVVIWSAKYQRIVSHLRRSDEFVISTQGFHPGLTSVAPMGLINHRIWDSTRREGTVLPNESAQQHNRFPAGTERIHE